MAGLKEVRVRIASVNSTKQVTSAMKMVSAAKLRKSQEAVLRLRPYAQKMIEIMGKVCENTDTSENAFAVEREIKNVLLIPVTSNRGLCGAFNTNVIKNTLKIATGTYNGKRVSVVSIGRKAQAFFRKTEHYIIGTDFARATRHASDSLDYNTVSEIVTIVMSMYAKKEFDKVVLIYNRFKNAASQVLMVEDFLPVRLIQTEIKKEKMFSSGYIFEPSSQEIISNLIPLSLKTQLFRALLESLASEHGARMTAMHKATDNADEMLKSLRLSYNKVRQATITKEILEIVGGAEALNA